MAVPKIPPGTFETISPPIIEGARAAIFAADEPTISPVAVLIEPSAAVLKTGSKVLDATLSVIPLNALDNPKLKPAEPRPANGLPVLIPVLIPEYAAANNGPAGPIKDKPIGATISLKKPPILLNISESPSNLYHHSLETYW